MFDLQMRKLKLSELKCLTDYTTAIIRAGSWDLRKHRSCFKGDYTLPRSHIHSKLMLKLWLPSLDQHN